LAGRRSKTFIGMELKKERPALKKYNVYGKLKARWSQIKTQGTIPEPRCGHTLNYLRTGRMGSLLVSFGESSKMKKRRFFQDVKLLDLEKKTWTAIPPAPFVPRGDHTANQIANNVFYFGGRWKQTLLGDAFFLSGVGTSNVRWISTHSDPTPGSRRGHTMTSLPKKNAMLLFGGLRGDIFLNDLWHFDVQKEKWMLLKISTDGKAPNPRCFHSAFTDKSQDNLFILGGSSPEEVHSSVIYRYDLRSRSAKWDLVPCTDMPPCIGHTSHLLPNQDLLLYGTHLSDRNDTAIPSEKCHVLGRTSKRSAIECELLQTTGDAPVPRQHHASILVGPKMYMFGGWQPTSQTSSNALYQLELQPTTPITPQRISRGGNSQHPSLFRHAINPNNGIAGRLTGGQTAEQGDRLRRGMKVTHSLVPVKAKKHAKRARPENMSGRVGPNAMLRTQFINPEMLQKQDRTSHDQRFTLKVINHLLTEWTPPPRGSFFLGPKALLSLCQQVLGPIKQEKSLVEMKAPCKVFGDIHGQFFDLLEFFAAFGSPDHKSAEGDIKKINYLFLGDYVDRGNYSLEVITLLLALKLQYGPRITLLRGNHEATDTNTIYGFHEECKERLGATDGETVWKAFNNVFSHLPLGALIEGKILCIHGGIGRVEALEEISKIKRPIPVRPHSADPVDRAVADLLWSDPTQGDGEKGVKENEARGVSTVFGPDVVMRFCKRNKIDLIVRAHQVVSDGYEYFANGHLLTIFSATNYCGRRGNNGAMLEIDSDLHVTIKYIECGEEAKELAGNSIMNLGPGSTRGTVAEKYFDFGTTNTSNNYPGANQAVVPAGATRAQATPEPIEEDSEMDSASPPQRSRSLMGSNNNNAPWRTLDRKRPPSPVRGESSRRGFPDSTRDRDREL